MVLILYLLSGALSLWLLHRFVCALSRPAAVFLLALPFLFVGHALIANRVYAPIDKTYQDEPLRSVAAKYGISSNHNPVTSDIYSQMIPWRHAVRESVKRGEWPLWNPYILSGDILAGAAQPAPYSPFTLLAILLPAPISFTFTAAMTFLVAAASAFVFARELDCREGAAAVAAAGFAYSSGMALYVLWPLGLCWALAPLVLLGVRRVATAPSVSSWALLTVGFTLLLLAGHGESALHIVSLGALYGVFEVLRHTRKAAGAAACAGMAGIVALLLCAIFLLPHLDVLPESAEYRIRMDRAGEHSITTSTETAAALVTNFFPFLHVRQWLDPAIPGVKAETAAVGSMILSLAFYAIWRVRSAMTWFWTGITLVCLGAHAAWRPVMGAIRDLPLFDITLHERLAFGAACSMVLLAAMGVEELARREDRRGAAITAAVMLALLTAGTIWIQRSFVVDPGPLDWGRLRTPAELGVLATAVVLLAIRIPMRMVPAGLVLRVLIQRTMSEGGVHKSFPATAAYPDLALFEPLRKIREPFRIVGHGFSLIPGTGALYGLEDVRGYEAMTFARYQETYQLWCEPQPVFFNRVDDLSRPFLSLLNVRFAIGDRSTPVPPGWRMVQQEGEAVLLENTRALGRAFVPRIASLGYYRGDVIERMKDASDFSERAWIEAEDIPREHANGPGRVSIRPVRWGYALDAQMDGVGWIVVTNTAWKGWRVYVDGKRVRAKRANAAFMGIHVPKGRHAVRLEYRPQAFVAGRTITFATMLGLGVFSVWSRMRGKAAKQRMRPSS